MAVRGEGTKVKPKLEILVETGKTDENYDVLDLIFTVIKQWFVHL